MTNNRRSDEQTIRWYRRMFREKLGLWEHAEVTLESGRVVRFKKVGKNGDKKAKDQENIDVFLLKMFFRSACISIGGYAVLNTLHQIFAVAH